MSYKNDMEQIKLNKNLNLVLETLKNDVLGLSANQIANNSRLSIKTVKNCIAVLLQQDRIYKDDLGVYHCGNAPADVEIAEILEVEPKVKPEVKQEEKPAAQTVAVEGFDAKLSVSSVIGNLFPIPPKAELHKEVEAAEPETAAENEEGVYLLKERVMKWIKAQPAAVTYKQVQDALDITERQAKNSCYQLEVAGYLTSIKKGITRHYSFAKEYTPGRVKKPYRQREPKGNDVQNNSPFSNWVEHRVVETKSVRLTEQQLEEVLKHVFGMDQVIFLTPLPDPYVVELKSEVVR